MTTLVTWFNWPIRWIEAGAPITWVPTSPILGPVLGPVAYKTEGQRSSRHGMSYQSQSESTSNSEIKRTRSGVPSRPGVGTRPWDHGLLPAYHYDYKNTLETCKNPRPTSGLSELPKSCTTSTMNFHMMYFSWIPQNDVKLKLSCKFGESKCNPYWNIT